MHSIRRVLVIMGICVLLAPFAPHAAERAGSADASPRFVRVGHYQCVCRQGDFEANLATVKKGLAQAVDAKLDIVSFPECFLTGYYAKGSDAREHAFTTNAQEMKRVLGLTAGCDTVLLVGFNELRDAKLYNTVAVIERGKLLGRYSKALPYEGYFEPGREFTVFEKKGLKFGVVICSDGGYIEPTRILALKGARFIFAPHFNFVSDPVQHYVTVRNDHIARAVENGVFFLRANNVVPGTRLEGLRDEGFGYGDSYLLDPNGQMVAGAGLFHEHLMIYQLDLDQKYRAAWNQRSIKSGTELLGQLREALELHKQPKQR
ncbi:MAG: carbon-nitrogen hydrolase family protein [Verrucomicrobia bacterium]|nr:carbon-nitrogen hydrolase family protein [Verrucomicrobiota bacterium]